MLTSAAVWLHPLVIEMTGDIMNSANPDQGTANTEFGNHGTTTLKWALRWIDYRFYQRLIILRSVYDSTYFMNVKSDLERNADVSTLFVSNICPKRFISKLLKIQICLMNSKPNSSNSMKNRST